MARIATLPKTAWHRDTQSLGQERVCVCVRADGSTGKALTPRGHLRPPVPPRPYQEGRWSHRHSYTHTHTRRRAAPANHANRPPPSQPKDKPATRPGYPSTAPSSTETRGRRGTTGVKTCIAEAAKKKKNPLPFPLLNPSSPHQAAPLHIQIRLDLTKRHSHSHSPLRRGWARRRRCGRSTVTRGSPC